MSGKNMFKKFISSVLIFTFFAIGLNPTIILGKNVEGEFKAPIGLSRSVLDIDGKQSTTFKTNEEFTINYKIVPEDIPAEDVFPELYGKDKEIVLVVDVSGSMDEKDGTNKTRLEQAQNAAKNFVERFEGEEGVKIALVPYSNKATPIKLNPNEEDKYFADMTNNSQVNNLIHKKNGEISKLRAEGGTNIGDGLKEAYYLLKDSGNSNARKHIVFMSDGEPTGFSYNSASNYYWDDLNWIQRLFGGYTTIGFVKEGTEQDLYNISNVNYNLQKGTTKFFINYGTSDHKGYSLEYANKVANDLINSEKIDIENFFIGFSSDAGKDKLIELSDITQGYYKNAYDGDALDGVYQQLAEQIQSDLPIHEMKYEEVIPNELEIISTTGEVEHEGQKIVGNIGSVSYRLNEETGNFEAEPFEFTIKLRGKKEGTYNLGGKITYKDIDGSFSEKNIDTLSINISETSLKPNASIVKENSSYLAKIEINEPAIIEIGYYNQDGYRVLKEIHSIKPFDKNEEKRNLEFSFVQDSISSNINNKLTMRAKDIYGNEITETIPLLYLSVDITDNQPIGNTKEARLNIRSESNATIQTLLVNGESKTKKVTIENGLLTLNVLLKGNNTIETFIVNEHGNTISEVANINLDVLLPIIEAEYIENYAKIDIKVNEEVNDLWIEVDLDENGEISHNEIFRDSSYIPNNMESGVQILVNEQWYGYPITIKAKDLGGNIGSKVLDTITKGEILNHGIYVGNGDIYTNVEKSFNVVDSYTIRLGTGFKIFNKNTTFVIDLNKHKNDNLTINITGITLYGLDDGKITRTIAITNDDYEVIEGNKVQIELPIENQSLADSYIINYNIKAQTNRPNSDNENFDIEAGFEGIKDSINIKVMPMPNIE